MRQKIAVINKKRFAEQLRLAREAKGLMQYEIAAKSGLTKNSINNYECGRSLPSLDAVLKLSEILDVSIDYLLDVEKSVWIQGIKWTHTEKEWLKELLKDACKKNINYSFSEHLVSLSCTNKEERNIHERRSEKRGEFANKLLALLALLAKY